MKGLLLNRLRDDRGATMVVYVVMMVALLGMAAVAVDTGTVAVEKSRLQKAADAAAMAAAYELPDTAKAIAAANRYVELNGISSSDIDVEFLDSNKTVSVTATREVQYTFARVFGIRGGTVVQGAKAQMGRIGGAFDYALFSGSTTSPLSLNGSSFTITGDVHTNQNFIINGSNCTINGDCEAMGTITVNGSNMLIDSRIPGAPFVDMPDFADAIRRQAEAVGQIHQGDMIFNGGSIDVSRPLYVEGNITINGSNFTGTGFLFATGNITFNGSSLKLSSSDAVCVYSQNGMIVINGSGATVDGILYAPQGAVTLNGSNQLVNGRVIGYNVWINGSRTCIQIRSDNSDLNCLPAGCVKLVK